MGGSVIGKVMSFGYPGSYSRMPDDVVINKPCKDEAGTAPIVFGTAVILNGDNTFSAAGAALTAANFAGIAVREVKQSTDIFADQGAYRHQEPTDVLARGCTVVKFTRGTPTAGGAVYYRTAVDAAVAGSAIGDIEAAAGAGLVALPNVFFTTGEVDPNNVVEISITKRNNN